MRLMSTTLLLGAIVLGGCKNGPSNINSNGNGNANNSAALSFKIPEPIKPVNTADPSFKPCNPYFPLVPGSIAKYVINYSSGIVGNLTVVVDAADENGRKVFTQRSQLVDTSGGMQIVQSTTRTFVCDGERVIILSEKADSNISGQQSTSEFRFRENSLMMTDPKSMLIKGSTWTHAFRPVYQGAGGPTAQVEETTVITFEVGSAQTITAAVGTFKAIPVTRQIGANSTVDYYVPGLGLVRRQSKEGTSWELKEYSGLQPVD